MSKKYYSIPFAYERYGKLEVEAENIKEAVEKAEEMLSRMSVSEMEELSSYLEDSEELDKEGDIICNDPALPRTPEEKDRHAITAMIAVKAWREAVHDGVMEEVQADAPFYRLLMDWSKELAAAHAKADIDSAYIDAVTGSVTERLKEEVPDFNCPEELPYGTSFYKQVLLPACYIMEAYMDVFLFGKGMIFKPDSRIDWPELLKNLLKWTKEIPDSESSRQKGAVAEYSFKRISEEQPERVTPIKLTVQEICEDWKTGAKRVMETHIVEALTYAEAFKKAYPYERALRYCSGHFMQIAEPEYMKRYDAWKQHGLTINMYYGGGTVD